MITCVTFDDVSLRFIAPKRLRILLEHLDELGLPATLFVVPYPRSPPDSAMNEFAECLTAAVDAGHEVAQHGSEHRGNRFISEFGCLLPIPLPQYAIQKQRIESGMRKILSLTGVKPVGFRSPFYLHNMVTLRALSDLGFLYDSSSTVFKPTHQRPLRARTLLDVKPHRVGRVLEIPVMGDYTYRLNACNFFRSLNEAFRDLKWAHSHDAVFVINNHPDRVDTHLLCSFLRFLHAKIAKDCEFMSLRDVANVFKTNALAFLQPAGDTMKG